MVKRSRRLLGWEYCKELEASHETLKWNRSGTLNKWADLRMGEEELLNRCFEGSGIAFSAICMPPV